MKNILATVLVFAAFIVNVHALSVSYSKTSFGCETVIVFGTFDCSFNGLVLVSPGAGELVNPPPFGLGYTVTNGTFSFEYNSNGSGPTNFNMNLNVTSSNNSCVNSTNNMLSTPMTHNCFLPPNNDCSGSITLAISSFSCTSSVFTTTNATDSGVFASCSGTGFNDLWYDFAANGSTINISFTNFPGSFIRYALWSTCGGSELACGIMFSSGSDGQLSSLTSGTNYKLQIQFLSSASGNQEICLYNPTGGTVPLEITSFDVELVTDKMAEVKLEATDLYQVDQVILQRSSNNQQDFDDIHVFDKEQHRTSDLTLNYYDEEISSHDIYYYRIKIVDIDGSIDYSESRYIKTNHSSRPNVEFYPNPTTDFITVNAINTNEPINIMVSDASGSAVISKTLLTDANHIVDMSQFNPGIYILRIAGSDFQESHKIVKY